MDNKVIKLLNALNDMIGIVDEYTLSQQTSEGIACLESYREKKIEIQDCYLTCNSQQRNELLQILEAEFHEEERTHNYLLSILIKSCHDIFLIDKLIESICRKQGDYYINLMIEYQIAYELFANNYPKKEAYDLRRRLHSYNVEGFTKLLQPPKTYRDISARNHNRIVLITDQLLGLHHAPTKILLEQCYSLQKNMGMEILLFVCPVSLATDHQITWFDQIKMNYFNELNGDYYISYRDGDISVSPKESNGIFYIEYKDIILRGKQVVMDVANLQAQKLLLQLIYEYNPLFVFNVNSINPLADICNCFTTVVASSMAYGYPVSEGDILLYLDNLQAGANAASVASILEGGRQIALNFRWTFQVDEPDFVHDRSHFQINEDEFVLMIVGNRLIDEITEEYVKVLEHILSVDSKVSILLIGTYPNYMDRFKAQIFYGRVHAIGYQDQLATVIPLADLYLNPPRVGGGTSALYALKAGVPVITLPDCDVAINVGREFTCINYEEMTQLIIKYKEDQEFYDLQRILGLKLVHSLGDVTSAMEEMLQSVKKIMMETEGKILHAD